MTKLASIVRRTRPSPPPEMLDDMAPIAFVPDQLGLGAWARETFIDEDGPLSNERHRHLEDAAIGWLWTNAEQANRDKAVAGECRLIGPAQRKWSSQMAHFQLMQWFGHVPDFLVTISAQFAATCDDWSFCALVEHELCHAAQDVDMFGEPRFTRDGNPIFRLVAHDVEQFVDVVARYGSGPADVAEMVRAANNGPTIGEARMTLACGNCVRKVA
jgi:hypothetical protein